MTLSVGRVNNRENNRASALDNCCIGQLLCWSIVVLDNCCTGKLLHWTIVALDNCCIGQLLHWTIVVLDNCCIGQLLCWSIVVSIVVNSFWMAWVCHNCHLQRPFSFDGQRNPQTPPTE